MAGPAMIDSKLPRVGKPFAMQVLRGFVDGRLASD